MIRYRDNYRDERLGWKCDLLTTGFRNIRANDKSFIAGVCEHFNARAEAIEAVLPEDTSLTGNKQNMISAEYDIAPSEHSDFFTAYIAALEANLTDLVIENPDLIVILNDMCMDAVADVYDTDISIPSRNKIKRGSLQCRINLAELETRVV